MTFIFVVSVFKPTTWLSYQTSRDSASSRLFFLGRWNNAGFSFETYILNDLTGQTDSPVAYIYPEKFNCNFYSFLCWYCLYWRPVCLFHQHLIKRTWLHLPFLNPFSLRRKYNPIAIPLTLWDEWLTMFVSATIRCIVTLIRCARDTPLNNTMELFHNNGPIRFQYFYSHYYNNNLIMPVFMSAFPAVVVLSTIPAC